MAILEEIVGTLVRSDAAHARGTLRGAGDPSEAQRIESALNEAFEKSSYPPLRRLRATVVAEVVELHGIVRSYYQKQIAQQAAMALLGSYAASQRLVNQVEVLR